MSTFPNNGLSAYQDFDATTEDGLKQLKADLRAWLKGQRLSFKWLAANLGRSEGTVKNWLYSSMNIPEVTQAQIFSVCIGHQLGGEGLTYPERPEPYHSVAYVHVALDDYARPDLWCMAAGVPHSAMASKSASKQPAGGYSKYNKEAKEEVILAMWITEKVMAATRSVLRDAKKNDKLAAVMKEEETYQASQKAFPSSIPSYLGGYLGGDDEVNIPVILQNWRDRFLRMAAKLQNLEPEQWIIKCLNNASMRQTAEDLEAFLDEEDTELADGMDKRPPVQPAASPCGYGYGKQDDDIPF